MGGRVLCLAGSPAACVATSLPEAFVPVALDPSRRLSPDEPWVLLIDAACDDPTRVAQIASEATNLAIVALVRPDAAAGEGRQGSYTGREDWYAVLDTTVPAPILARTLQNALEHMATRSHLARLSNELQELNAIGVRLSAERDLPALLELILTTARAITHSDAGSLYLVEDDGHGRRRLRFILAQNDSVPVPFQSFTLPLDHQSVAGHVALSGHPLALEDAYALPPGATFRINRTFDQQVGYRTKSMLVVPMKTPQQQIIGVLQLINCKADRRQRLTSSEAVEQETRPFGSGYADLASSLASQAAVALENSRLYASIQALFEGFVKASVSAIESRDPTTSGHSFRVAELTVGLAEVVDRASAGRFARTRFTADEIKEIRYASLLHDFGKVGVREDVLVKAKKLAPQHLELIRRRVESIRHGLELRYSQQKIEYLLHKGRERFAEHAEFLDAELTAFVAELEAGLARVLEANEPTVMPKDVAAAIQRVALQTFEDQVGRHRPIITPDEARVLVIPRGSLTPEERKQIESHVVHTYRFLAQIPWTRELRNVPAIAGSHHEKLDGSGYPSGVRAEDIPLQSRMMTIADIYDALTAGDRPYKRAMPVEHALDILRHETNAGAIDADLLDLFVDARVFARTAAR
jgi:HD-GYP domain-containing protein (c-di-GMP phosphodiesterase class II)